MEALILLGISFVAISTLVGLNAAVGGWTRSSIESLDAAAALVRRDSPGFAPGDGVLGADGRAAIVVSADGAAIGLVAAQGDRFVVRQTTPDHITRADAGKNAALVVTLDDFTLPRIVVALSTHEEALAWARRLTGAES